MLKKPGYLIGGIPVGEFAAQWGCDSHYDTAPNQKGDGALFYNFGSTTDSSPHQSGQEFLSEFLPAIDRTIASHQKHIENTVPEFHPEMNDEVDQLRQLRAYVAKMLEYDDFTRAYIECALFTSIVSYEEKDERYGDPFDQHYTIADLSDEAKARAISDCADFRKLAADLLAQYTWKSRSYSVDQCAGHDFWYTRNGHGVGFWDRGLGKLGQDLSAAAKTYGETSLYLGDDGKIYLE